MIEVLIEVTGWVGAFLLLVAFFLLTKGKLKPRSLIYQLLNLLGSIMVGINAFFNHAYPSLAINIVWLLIALWGIENLLEHKH